MNKSKSKIGILILNILFLFSPLFSYAAITGVSNTGLDSSQPVQLFAPASNQTSVANTGLNSNQPINLTPVSANQVPVNNTSLNSTQAISLNNTTSTYTGSSCTTPKDIGTLFDFAKCLLSESVIPFVIGLGVLLFLIGVLQYVAAGDNEEKREASRNMMIYGIIAIFVMVSVWGFVKMLSTTFGFDYALPTLPPSGNNSALN